MSRSRKKNPGFYITLHANRPGVRKKEKQEYNRAMRRASKRGKYYYKVREYIDVWSMCQDGEYIRIDIFKNGWWADEAEFKEKCSRK